MEEEDLNHHAQETGAAYTWEAQYKRSWDMLQEDAEGTLNTALLQLMQQQQQRRRRDALSTGRVQRGILRHLVLVLDCSSAMASRDFKPSYLELTIQWLRQWLLEFFDQNPISQLCMIITKNGLAQRVSQPSGNPIDHIRVLDAYMDQSLLTGEPSLQNSLEMAISILKQSPEQSSREILFLMASLTSRDPQDVQQTVEKLIADRGRCSIISLTAEVNICKQICRQTGGEYRVAINEAHYRDLLWSMLPPPPVLVAQSAETGAKMILMGFPDRSLDGSRLISLCACHDRPTGRGGYVCPRCRSKVCELPADCPICGLKLISSPHIARSYHHLFPIPAFTELAGASTSLSPETPSNQCHSCRRPLIGGGLVAVSPALSALKKKNPETTIRISLAGLTEKAAPSANTLSPAKQSSITSQQHPETIGRRQSMMATKLLVPPESQSYQCPSCLNVFCFECDLFIHESLHNCPGCL